ncbi:MAG TPA: hypothetical protein PKO39_08145 [Bacilli bacterium]|nr:hypothetical protein [Bacilli bacterium]
MMQQLSLRKKHIFFPILLILLSIGALTFAWFTLTPKVNVEKFEAEIKAASGIEVSLDGVKFVNHISNEDIINQIKTNLHITNGKIVLDAVTTANGYDNYKKLDFTSYPGIPVLKSIEKADEENPGKWIWFYLYFRTPEPDIWAYLTSDTYVTSDGWLWYSDVEYRDTLSFGYIAPGKSKMIYSANCLRMSFLTYDIDETKIGSNHPISDNFKSAVIYELDPLYKVKPNLRDENQRLDKTLKPYGLIDYFRAKTGNNNGINLLDFFTNDVLPEGVLNNAHLVDAGKLDEAMTGKAAVVKLDTYHEESGYYYGAVKTQMWIEGWDPDCYNAILKDRLKIRLFFAASSQAPGIIPAEIDSETEYTIEYIHDAAAGLLTHENPITVKKYELPYFPLPGLIENRSFHGWYWDESYENSCKFIPKDPDYVIIGDKKVIRLYAKISG